MTTSTLSLHDAKNRFSAVVEAAQRGEPQLVTKGGVPAVVVISAEENEQLRHCISKYMPPIRDHLLAMPTDDVEFGPLKKHRRHRHHTNHPPRCTPEGLTPTPTPADSNVRNPAH